MFLPEHFFPPSVNPFASDHRILSTRPWSVHSLTIWVACRIVLSQHTVQLQARDNHDLTYHPRSPAWLILVSLSLFHRRKTGQNGWSAFPRSHNWPVAERGIQTQKTGTQSQVLNHSAAWPLSNMDRACSPSSLFKIAIVSRNIIYTSPLSVSHLILRAISNSVLTSIYQGISQASRVT